MTPLPGIDAALGDKLTEAQIDVIAAVQYVVVAFFVGVLILAIINFVQIIIVQKRWGKLPLSLFYILTILTTISRVLGTLFVYFEKPWTIFFNLLAPTAKLEIGLIQLWMVVELALKLRTGIALAKDPKSKTLVTGKLLYRA